MTCAPSPSDGKLYIPAESVMTDCPLLRYRRTPGAGRSAESNWPSPFVSTKTRPTRTWRVENTPADTITVARAGAVVVPTPDRKTPAAIASFCDPPAVAVAPAQTE